MSVKAVAAMVVAGALAAAGAGDQATSIVAPPAAALVLRPIGLAPAGASGQSVGEQATGGGPTSAGLARALLGPLRSPALGGRVAIRVTGAGGAVLYALGRDSAVPPASTAKLAVAAAALRVLGPSARLETTVVRGSTANSVVLVGGGDPTLASPTGRAAGRPDAGPGALRPAQLAGLARGTAAALSRSGVRSVSLGLDVSRFTGPATAPGWKASYLQQNVAPVVALETDGGRARPDRSDRVADPAYAAGRAFAALLARAGVTVTSIGTLRTPAGARPPKGSAPPSAAAPAPVLARVASPPMTDLVEHLLTTSDNDLAEALGRAVARASGRPADFSGATAAIAAAVEGLGVGPGALAMADASGLSALDRLRPSALTAILTAAASPGHPELGSVLSGLPVAGFSGTLAMRFTAGRAARAAGLVRAKTGNLHGMASLAGLVRTASGRILVFAAVSDRVAWVTSGEAALDDLAASLAACGCR